MSDTRAFGSRAEVRRARALTTDADRWAILPALAATAFPDGGAGAGTTDALELLIAYLLDPAGGALLATTDARAAWLAAPLFAWVGPGNAAPLYDDLAAMLAAPALTARVAGDGLPLAGSAAGGRRGGIDGKRTSLSPLIARHRFAPRADDAVALAVAALEPAVRGAIVEQLFADAGPEPALLALSTVQCGRILAWTPELAVLPIAGRIVDALVALLHPSRPKPLLDLVARALGPIARRGGPLGDRVRKAALAALDATTKPAAASFAAEVAAIGRKRALPDEDRMRALPVREVASAAAYVLGFAAPEGRTPFAAHRALVLERPDGDAWLAPFVEGLVAAAHVPAIDELVTALLAGDDDDVAAAISLAAALPLDQHAETLIALLDDGSPARRAGAIEAVAMLDLDGTHVDAALVARLGDPSPSIAAIAARTLLERGRDELVREHAAREGHTLRGIIARTATGDLSVPVIATLVDAAMAELGENAADQGDDTNASPLRALLGDALMHSADGLEVAAAMLSQIPAAASLLALACATEGRDVGVLAPPGARAAFAAACLALAEPPTDDGGRDEHADELGALALYTLAHVSAGDEVIVGHVADALANTTGSAGELVAALGELRVASEVGARALAPLVAADAPIGSRVIAAAACGRALPADHRAWDDVRELLELGTIARAAAWTAVRDRARRA